MSLARRGLHVFLAALLLFSQQQAGLHLLGHGLARLTVAATGIASEQDSSDPQEMVCAKCLAVAHLDHALAGAAPVPDAIALSPERVAVFVAAHRDPAFFASYRSRAPPPLA